MALPTRDDLFAAARRSATTRPSKISRAAVDAPGSTANFLCEAGATIGEEVAIFSAQTHAEQKLATAARIGGAVLDRAAYDRYGSDLEPRRTATVAVVPLTFTRGAPGVGFTIPAGTRFATSSFGGPSGIVFATIAPVVFQATDTGPFVVGAAAETSGLDGNVAANTITVPVDLLDDESVTVTNAEPAAGGDEDEDDSSFYGRVQGYFTAARRGTRTAVEYGAGTTPGVYEVSLVENLDPQTLLPAFRARLTVADRNGAANSELAANVRARLEDWRALGCPVTVLSGQPEYVSIVITGLVYKAGTNTAYVREQIRAAIVAAIGQLAPGETLELSLIISTLKSFAQYVNVPSGAIAEPSGDLEPTTQSSTIRTRADLVSINGS